MALRTKTRPGPKDAFIPTTSAQAVINELVKDLGGLESFAEYISKNTSKTIYFYDINNWRKRGTVPLTHVIEAAKALKVSPYLLCFVKLAEVRNTLPSWKKLVIDEFDMQTAHDILKLPHPKLKVSTK